MKLLLVSKTEPYSQAVSAITKYVEVGRALGHEVAVFGEKRADLPQVHFSLDVKHFDVALFIVYWPADFPDLPYLAQLLDGMPKDRRVIVDCAGRYNETIRVEHDFNHLEKLDGHQSWEWLEGFEAVSNRILQPALKPRRSDVESFLFFGYDPAATARAGAGAAELAKGWLGNNGSAKPYGVTYVGNNWQRWSQIARFLEAVEPLKDRLGKISLAGWTWEKRPEWAIEHGIDGVNVDVALLDRLAVERKTSMPFHEVIGFQGQGRFCPVFHRPLFNELGMVTNRTFETFCSDTLPLLMLPEAMVEPIYGPAGRLLAPGADVAGRVADMLDEPVKYWEAVVRVREHLAQHHSYEQRFKELVRLLGQ